MIAVSILISSPANSQQSGLDQWGLSKNDWLTLAGPEFRQKVKAANRRAEIEAAANRGEIDAMTIAAGALSNDTWGPPDFVKAYVYASKAAELDSPRAMATLGFLLYNGRGIAANKEAAFNWYLRAAELGQVQAMLSVAQLLERGDGVPKDGTRGLEWYRKAAAGNAPEPSFWLASALWNAVGGEKDQAGAFSAMKVAAEGRHPEAMYWYGSWLSDPEISGSQSDQNASTAWLRMSTEAGYEGAEYDYAYRLFNGIGTAPNAPGAIAIFRRSATAGNINSQFDLASILVYGRDGIPASRVEADRLFRDVADNPKSPANLIGKSLFNLGVIAELDRQYQTARSFYQKAAAAGYVDNQNALANLNARIAEEAEQARRDFFAFSGRTANGLLYVLSNAGLPANFDQRDVRVSAQCTSWLNSTHDFAGQRMTGLAWLKLEKSSSSPEAEAAWTQAMMNENGYTRQRVEGIRNKMRELSFLTLKSSGCVNISYNSSFSVIVPDGQ